MTDAVLVYGKDGEFLCAVNVFSGEQENICMPKSEEKQQKCSRELSSNPIEVGSAVASFDEINHVWKSGEQYAGTVENRDIWLKSLLQIGRSAVWDSTPPTRGRKRKAQDFHPYPVFSSLSPAARKAVMEQHPQLPVFTHPQDLAAHIASLSAELDEIRASRKNSLMGCKCGAMSREELFELPVGALRHECAQLNLPTKGGKKVLIQRILAGSSGNLGCKEGHCGEEEHSHSPYEVEMLSCLNEVDTRLTKCHQVAVNLRQSLLDEEENESLIIPASGSSNSCPCAASGLGCHSQLCRCDCECSNNKHPTAAIFIEHSVLQQRRLILGLLLACKEQLFFDEPTILQSRRRLVCYLHSEDEQSSEQEMDLDAMLDPELLAVALLQEYSEIPGRGEEEEEEEEGVDNVESEEALKHLILQAALKSYK